jgi:hypothetical protein
MSMTVPNADFNSDSLMNEVISKVSKGECILFMGAGVHYPPPSGSPYDYPVENQPPLGSALAERLAKETNFSEIFPNDSVRNLQRVSLHYELTKGRNALVNKINESVDKNKKPSPILNGLAELDFRLIGTTNYDRLFEKALYSAQKDPVICVYNKERNVSTMDYQDSVPDPQRPFLFKIHGCVDAGKSIVITDEDYIEFVMRMNDKGLYNPIPETFSYYLKKWPTLFIGYSLIDYNLRLLLKTLRWVGDQASIPNTYSVDPYPDNMIYKIYSHPKGFVHFFVQDVWTFVPELYRRIKGKDLPK